MDELSFATSWIKIKVKVKHLTEALRVEQSVFS